MGKEEFKLVRNYARENQLKEDEQEDLVALFRYYDGL